MASTDTTKKPRAAKPVTSAISSQIVRTFVKDFLRNFFANTLAREVDVENVVMALMYRESAFRPDAKGPDYGGSHVRKILTYSAVKNKYESGTAEERQNILNSAAAFGLGQVTGYYAIQGCGAGGKGELERLRPDLAGQIMVPPGVDVRTKLIGDDNVPNQVLASLIVLEGKYKEVAPRLVSQGRYTNKLTAAVSAYLGLGAADSLGTTPEAYANSIIRGSAYAAANGGKGPQGRALVAGQGTITSNPTPAQGTAGPPKTAASGNVLSVAGC